MNLQRKLTLLVATGALALGAGHVVQKRAAERMAAAQPDLTVSSITPVAAGPDRVEIPATAPKVELPPLPVSVVDAPPAPETPVLAAADPAPEMQPPVAAAAPEVQDCPVQLSLIPQAGGMIGLSLLAPCHSEERIVLRHAGVAVTGKTSASGAYFGALPALTQTAEVEVLFSSSDRAKAELAIPEAAQLRRFVVQWQDADAFQLHAFESGAGYNQPGHYSAAFAGTPGQGAFMTLLGDSTTDLPLLAEVFTYAPGQDAEIVLEAAVTETTCGREIIGETVMAEAGVVDLADLSLAMPGCEAIGDILVLKNLVQDMKLAAAK